MTFFFLFCGKKQYLTKELELNSETMFFAAGTVGMQDNAVYQTCLCVPFVNQGFLFYSRTHLTYSYVQR